MSSLPLTHLVLIDGHHLMYRAYWAIPRAMKTSRGEQVNAVFGFFSMLLQILRTEQPDALLLCFDKGSATFRHREFQEYKAGRAETPDDFYTQIPLIFSLLDTWGLRTVADENYEADDFACTYARMAEKAGDRVTIVTGDRDLLQVVSPSIRVAVPHKGYQSPEYCTPEKVLEAFGVTPGQIADYKALVGDASDNYGGVSGIGPKAATALLRQFHSLDGVYADLSSVKRSWREKLISDREKAFFCRRMAVLRSDAPCTFSLEDLRLGALNAAPILASFQSLDFHLLSKRLVRFLQSEEGAKYADRGMASYAVSHVGEDQGAEHNVAQLSLL